MGVLLANCQIGVRVRGPAQRDGHGDLVPGDWGALARPWPSRKLPLPDGTWHLALDPRAWPLRSGDLAVEPSSGTVWTVLVADLITSSIDGAVEYVRVVARDRDGGGTRPDGHP